MPLKGKFELGDYYNSYKQMTSNLPKETFLYRMAIKIK